MDSANVTVAAFAVICAGTALGFIVKNYLREHHADTRTQDAVKVATGVVASMTALVLGLLVASAKSNFDGHAAEVRNLVVNITLLNRSLRGYQPPLTDQREALAQFTRDLRDKLWDEKSTLTNEQVMSRLDQVRDKFRQLDPQSLQDKALKDRLLSLSDTIILLADELLLQEPVSVPIQMIIVVDAWLAITFFAFALFAPFNLVSAIALGIGAAAVALALFMIVEMDSPFQGFVNVSPAPMDLAIAVLSRT
ncbi:MAG TPA: hypothetical protein VG651_19120 [Stellaceae bacterium]|nr:hypothetical protein [Stellaceae bacterium]